MQRSTWVTTKLDEKKLEVFKSKVLKMIFGPKSNNEGDYEIRSDLANNWKTSMMKLEFVEPKKV